MFRGCRGRSSWRRLTSSRSSISCLLTTAQRFLGSSSSFVTVGRRIPSERERFLFAAVFFAISRSWWFGVFCACFVLFERSVKLRETAIEQESLQAAYSFLYPVAIFGPATPLLYARYSFKETHFGSSLGWSIEWMLAPLSYSARIL